MRLHYYNIIGILFLHTGDKKNQIAYIYVNAKVNTSVCMYMNNYTFFICGELIFDKYFDESFIWSVSFLTTRFVHFRKSPVFYLVGQILRHISFRDVLKLKIFPRDTQFNGRK